MAIITRKRSKSSERRTREHRRSPAHSRNAQTPKSRSPAAPWCRTWQQSMSRMGKRCPPQPCGTSTCGYAGTHAGPWCHKAPDAGTAWQAQGDAACHPRNQEFLCPCCRPHLEPCPGQDLQPQALAHHWCHHSRMCSAPKYPPCGIFPQCVGRPWQASLPDLSATCRCQCPPGRPCTSSCAFQSWCCALPAGQGANTQGRQHMTWTGGCACSRQGNWSNYGMKQRHR